MTPPPTRRPTAHEPIAVIGMACRFAGANSPAELWEVVRGGVDATSETPANRYDVSALYSQTPKRGQVASRRAGYIHGIDAFDAEFFGIPQAEARDLDPQQRLLMTVAWEALEDAGIVPDAIAGSRTGVYVGNVHGGYADRLARRGLESLTLAHLLNYRSMLPARLSYLLDLRGPSISLDTACSASLTAVHMACQSLRTGETTLALAGGVNLKLTADEDVALTGSRMLASDGRTKFGDAGADGLVPSDGVGIVVLKPLEAALADRDRVRAVVLGSAVNSDGAAGGSLLAPAVEAHADMLRQAYAFAGVSPSDVDYVEAHGTGTPAIDPVEFTALGEVLGEGRPADRPLFIGSVKTNIGHAEAAAGVAGLIKTILCLEHREVAPSLNHHTPNPMVAWDELPLVVPTGLHTLPDHGRPALAGVSGQGISSVNVHVVVQEADPGRGAPRPRATPGRTHLLALSARAPRALADLARAYIRYLEPAGAGHGFEIRDICHSAATRRRHHPHRLAVLGSSHEDLAAELRGFLEGAEAARPSGASGDPARLARDYVRGLPVDWQAAAEPGGRYVPLPTYQWQNRSYWFDERS